MPEAARWTEDRMRSLLRSAEQALPAEHRSIAGAGLGNLLRRLDSTFRADVLGDPSLTLLLRRFPDLGSCENSSSGMTFHFGESAGRETAGVPYLLADLWRAFVLPDPALARYFDLADGSVVFCRRGPDGNPAAGSRPGQEPERFLALPAITDAEMRNVAREFVEGLAPEVERQPFLDAVAGEDWFTEFCRVAATAGREREWLTHHRRHVVGRAGEWANAHGIAFSKLLRARYRRGGDVPGPANATAARPGRVGSRREGRDELRALLHTAIDRMSEGELLDLRVPLRYVLHGK